MSEQKIPQHGDPELLPKEEITWPSNRRMPFGPSGVLLPKGPEFDVSRSAPDLKGLPWERFDNDEWTSEEQRAEVLLFLKEFFKAQHPTFVTWKVIERDRLDRMSTIRLRNPFLIFKVTRREDRKEIEASVDFHPRSRETIEAFRKRVREVEAALLAAHAADPAAQSGC